ncbi:MAG: hypothetical protein V7603_6393 [Micromonosporaceae bacterium]
MPESTIQARIDLPDTLWHGPPEQRDAARWLADDLCQLPDGSGFARCLLPVRLTGDTTITFGTWMAVPAEQVLGAQRAAGTPDYRSLRLTGTLANAVEPWGTDLLGAPVRGEVRDPNHLPYLTGSDHPVLSRVLTEAWDRDAVLSGLTFALPVPVRHRLDERWSIERSAGLVPRVVRGRQQFVGSGRKVLISSYTTAPASSAEEVLRMVTDGAAPGSQPVTERDTDGRHIRHAMSTVAEVDGTAQHELYGFTIGPGGFLETVCIHEDPADATWAMDVWRSVRQHG